MPCSQFIQISLSQFLKEVLLPGWWILVARATRVLGFQRVTNIQSLFLALGLWGRSSSSSILLSFLPEHLPEASACWGWLSEPKQSQSQEANPADLAGQPWASLNFSFKTPHVFPVAQEMPPSWSSSTSLLPQDHDVFFGLQLLLCLHFLGSAFLPAARTLPALLHSWLGALVYSANFCVHGLCLWHGIYFTATLTAWYPCSVFNNHVQRPLPVDTHLFLAYPSINIHARAKTGQFSATTSSCQPWIISCMTTDTPP